MTAATTARSAAIVLLATLGAACHTPGASQPDLVLVVIDALRADHLASYGYHRPTSPHIDRLAEQGILFTNASAPSSWTRPSVASLFTSRSPSEHGAVSLLKPLAGKLPTLAERLGEAGYLTIGVSANFVHVTKRSGLARGFEVWRSFSKPVEEGSSKTVWTAKRGAGQATLRAPSGAELNAAVIRRIPAPDAGPIFLYVHYMEPHSPYVPPPRLLARIAGERAGERRREAATNDYLVDLAARRVQLGEAERQELVDLYDAEIAAVDEAIGDLVAALQERDRWENTVMVITSDHGEEFADHGGWFHAINLHSESLRVPLVVHDARIRRTGDRRSVPVDLLDVPMTLLDLAGVPASPGMRGRSLLDSDLTPGRDLVAELHEDPAFERRIGPRTHRLALTRWPWKAIVNRDGDAWAYQLERDPLESSAVPPGQVPPDLLSSARDLERRFDSSSSRPQATEPDESTREGLRALGYAE
jgi:arylsulfatase A-like enzyme